MTKRRLAILLGLLCLGAMPVRAQRYVASAPAVPVADRAASAKANATTVGFLGGELGGTTLRFAVDLSNVLNTPGTLRVLPLIGHGGYDSAEDLLYLHGVDVAILPSDLFGYYKRTHLNPGAENSINYIAKLYDQELHILARGDIKSLADLAHQKVGADQAGTASSVTAGVMFADLNIPADLVNESAATSLEKLKRGDLAAMIFLAGKPITLFSSLPAAAAGTSGLHFLSVPSNDALQEAYLPARIDHASYPNLVPDGDPVDTIAVGAVMAAYAWPAGSERAEKVRTFVDALFAKFPALQKPPNHPRWTDVNLGATLAGWKRLPAAEDALRRATASK